MKEKRRSDMELKRAVIMGATGAIGMALTEYLLEKQWDKSVSTASTVI